MPELPDVAVFKKYFDSTALHKKIKGSEIGDKRILRDVSARKVSQALSGTKFKSTRRHGKHLFVLTAGKPVLRLHFGMTGGLKYFKHMEDEPRHDRLRIDFANGYHLAYIAQRMLGGVGVIDDVDAFIEEKSLGPDALEVSFERFRQEMAKRAGSLKSTLMNQQAVAGLGNVYTDEILFQAKLDPRRKPKELGDSQVKKLYEAMQNVLNVAIDKGADARELPDDFLIHYRGEGETCPKCGGKVQPIRVSGRRAWYCPKCQK